MFLTRLPAPRLQQADDAIAQRSLLFYPVVGAIIGVLLLAFIGACWWYNPQVSSALLAALVTAIWLALTGALHLDGLADSVDAWIGGLGDQAKTLAIMKDPTVGPMGACALMVVILIQFTGLQALLETAFLPSVSVQTASLQQGAAPWLLLIGALLLVPALARTSVLVMLATTPYLRANGLARALVAGATPLRIVIMVSILALLAGVLLQQKAILVLLLCVMLNMLARQMMMSRLGGCTGDTLGANIAVQEALLLAAIAL
jgi:adenosylcobinamide-GDP ribazoletransferase